MMSERQLNKRKESMNSNIDNASVEQTRPKVKRPRQLVKQELQEYFKLRCSENAKVLIDMDFDELMKESERKSLHSQIVFLYGKNKECSSPSQLTLCGLSKESMKHFERVGAKQWSDWGFSHTTDSLESVIEDKSRAVYLSADAEEEIEDFDPATTYIVGGLVDKNRHKGVVKEKAERLGIKTAKFPLGKYFDSKPKLIMRKFVLTVNHVVGIINDVQATRNWNFAFDRCVPQRLLHSLDDEAKLEDKESSKSHVSTDKSNIANMREVAVITGATSGIGKGFATELYNRGYNLVLVGRDPVRLRNICTLLRQTNTDTDAPLVIPYVGDCSKRVHMSRLKFTLSSYFSMIHVLVLSAGTFKWDDDNLFSSTSEAKQYLRSSNLVSKQYTVESLISLVCPYIRLRFKGATFSGIEGATFEVEAKQPLTQSKSKNENVGQKRHIIFIGSEAGKPDFIEMLEKREGKGAADNEDGYICSMQEVREWALDFKGQCQRELKSLAMSENILNLILLEPGLIRTPLTEKEFAKFNIDWSQVETPLDYARKSLASLNI